MSSYILSIVYDLKKKKKKTPPLKIHESKIFDKM